MKGRRVLDGGIICDLASTGSHPSPQQGDLRLSDPPSGQGAVGGARTRDRRLPDEIRADSLSTTPATPPTEREK
ncbi:hypothetical protein PoB_002182800 [Plakobranchus ocellatus]|uniref:Uncharacterized protein n=1 Tax=Plakobranchus ocellatus TaxID=259542 RepID=A0AAV3ZL54_9GAST|nr:hypothetical protein PoB_002182800 [Plakobranchus ocellatus]